MSINEKEVLIVDDLAESRFVASRIVRGSGMIPAEAESVDEALAYLQDKTPHLILLDLSLLGRSGFAFLEERARDARLASIPLIVLSATADKESICRALTHGASDYVIKPASASVLLRKIKKALRDVFLKSYRFPQNHSEPVTIRFTAQISRSRETEFSLAATIRLAPGTRVRVKDEYLDKLGLGSCLYVARSCPDTRDSEGSYLNRIDVMGLPKTLTRLIRGGR